MQNISKKPHFIVLLASALLICMIKIANSQSQPIVVLEYPNFSKNNNEYSDNKFVQNYDYSTTHKVELNETLSHILENYYAGSGLNLKFIEMAIVTHNKHAFVKNNPNFLFAEKILKLPSINQIQAMLLGDNAPESSDANQNDYRRTQEIYFIGG